MKNLIKISTAGNIEPTLFEVIIRKGYALEIAGKTWIAKKPYLEFRGDNIIELAGVVLLYETKGNNWKTSDSVVDDYLEFLRKNEE